MVSSLNPSRRSLVAGAALVPFALALARPARAASDQQDLVDQARITVDGMGRENTYGAMRAYMKQCYGVLIVPQLLKAGFIIGGSGGSGVLVGRNTDGTWSSPAFYTLAAGSIGLQIGAQAAEVVLVILKPHGLDAVLKNEMKLGADASIAVGPVGSGIQAATTTNLEADILSYARAKGLFAGASLEGSGIIASADSNKAYYGRAVNPRDIVVNRTVTAPGAAALAQTLAAVTKL